MRSCHVAECIIVVPTSINPTPPTINCTTPFHLVKAANLAISETLFAPVPSGHGAMSQGSNSTPTPEEAKGHQLQASMMKSQGRHTIQQTPTILAGTQWQTPTNKAKAGLHSHYCVVSVRVRALQKYPLVLTYGRSLTCSLAFTIYSINSGRISEQHYRRYCPGLHPLFRSSCRTSSSRG